MDGLLESARRLPPLTIMGWLRFDAIRRVVGRVRPQSVIELGCGEGAMAGWFATRATYVGVEPDMTSRHVATARVECFARAQVVGSLGEVAVTDVDLAGSFEVLEHIDDDVGALTELSARVRPGGTVLLSVPAHPDRYGASDRLVGHHRRYSRGALVDLMESAGLVVESLESYGAGGGHMLDRMQDAIAARKLRGRSATVAPDAVGTAGSGRYRQPGSGAGALMRAMSAAPFRLAQVPFGGSDIGIGYVASGRTQRPSS